MSGFKGCAPFLDGVTVAVEGADAPLILAADVLRDLGAATAEVAAADVVLASRLRPAGAAPSAIWVAVTPFGATGPRAAWGASDLGVMAASGNLWATGDPDRPPVRCAGNAAYAHTGPEVAFAAITALAAGVRPIDVDVSMQEVVSIANMGAAGRYARSANRGRRLGANIGRTREIWRCLDGWVSFGLRGGKARVPSLETIASLADLARRDWSAFDVNKVPADELAAIEAAVGAFFATKGVAELYELACTTNLMLAPINSPKELYESAQLAARGFFAEDGSPARWYHWRSRSHNPDRSGVSHRGHPRSVTPERGGGAGAWAGTRILELGAGAAGPIATRYFAEHGATVLRIESRSRPDFLRTGAYGEMFDALNAGKRSVSLNLKHPDGHALARRLVAEWADAVAENFAPKALRGLGLTYDDLVVDGPDLVMISACLNGQTGPHRDYPGFGGQGSALAGFNFLTGWPDREPIGPFGTITDSLAPRFVAAALGAALLHRTRTGLGAYIDISQVECAAWTLREWLVAWRRDGVVGQRLGNGHPAARLHDLFACAGDDRWIAIACWSDEELGRLHDVVGDDVAVWTSSRSPLAAAEALQAAGVEAVPVQDFGDVHDDQQLAHRAHLVALDHAELGAGEYERNGFRIAGTPSGYDRPGPRLGEDTEWALGDVLGLGSTEQRRLQADGALD